jgi:hypothetical protein
VWISFRHPTNNQPTPNQHPTITLR